MLLFSPTTCEMEAVGIKLHQCVFREIIRELFLSTFVNRK